jgi:hypothetical protein
MNLVPRFAIEMSDRRDNLMKQYLDRTAARINALLVVIAIGLGMLDMTVVVGKAMMAVIAGEMPATQAQVSGSGNPFASSKPSDPAATRP